MAKSTGITIGQFINSMHDLTNKNDHFMKEFSEYSRAGDRHAMIDLMMQQKEASKLDITSLRTGKDNIKAQELYEKAQKHDRNVNKISCIMSKISLLNEAMLTVTLNSPLFIEILSACTRLWFNIGLYTKCIKTCDYAMHSLNDEENQKYQHKDECNKLFKEIKKRALKAISDKSGHKMNGNNNIYTSPLNAPAVDGKRNKKLKSCSDAITLAFNSLMGRHLVATRNVKTGSVLIVDEPFAFSTDQQALSTNCLHCHVSFALDEQIQIPCANCQMVSFCSIKCRQEAWNNYHKYECPILENFMENSLHSELKSNNQRSHLLLAFRATVMKAIDKQTVELNYEFLKYQEDRNNNENDSSNKYTIYNPDLDIYDPLDYKTVYSLETHCEKADPRINFLRAARAIYLSKCLEHVLKEIKMQADVTEKVEEVIREEDIKLIAVGMMRHLQAIDCNAYEIVENIRDEATKTWEPRNIGGAIYTTVSLANHSCYPNIVRHSYPNGKVVVRALRFIEKGSEILDCYGPHFISDDLSTRQNHLRGKYHFSCTCDSCQFNWKLSTSTDPLFRCAACGSTIDSIKSRCQMSSCSRKADMKKLHDQLTKSIKKRITAIGKMYDGYYSLALPLLLEHAAVMDKILISPNIEAIKTQQSTIQCYNSMGNISKQFVPVIT